MRQNLKTFTGVILICMMIISLASCGEKKEETPEQAVDNVFTALKEQDPEKLKQYVDLEKLKASQEFQKYDIDIEFDDADAWKENEKYIKLFVQNLDYKIISSKSEDDTATVSVEITNVDMAKVMADYMQKAFEIALTSSGTEEAREAMMEQALIDLLNDEEVKKVTIPVDIKLTKSESSWKINMNEELANALSGGLVDIVKEMQDAFGGLSQ